MLGLGVWVCDIVDDGVKVPVWLLDCVCEADAVVEALCVAVRLRVCVSLLVCDRLGDCDCVTLGVWV